MSCSLPKWPRTRVRADVVVISLSLGDLKRPYAGRIGPWARLMDWLSFRYRVLFLISAGNVCRWLPIRDFATTAD